MSKSITIIVSIVLGLHGLIHLIGTLLYMKLTEVEGFTYKTTLLGGRWDLGEKGIRIFGALWVVPAVGFVIIAVAMLAGWGWWQPALIAISLFSLILTVFDWNVAYAGAIIDVVILVALWLGPRFGVTF
jgi:hypothetical protein